MYIKIRHYSVTVIVGIGVILCNLPYFLFLTNGSKVPTSDQSFPVTMAGAVRYQSQDQKDLHILIWLLGFLFLVAGVALNYCLKTKVKGSKKE